MRRVNGFNVGFILRGLCMFCIAVLVIITDNRNTQANEDLYTTNNAPYHVPDIVWTNGILSVYQYSWRGLPEDHPDKYDSFGLGSSDPSGDFFFFNNHWMPNFTKLGYEQITMMPDGMYIFCQPLVTRGLYLDDLRYVYVDRILNTSIDASVLTEDEFIEVNRDSFIDILPLLTAMGFQYVSRSGRIVSFHMPYENSMYGVVSLMYPIAIDSELTFDRKLILYTIDDSLNPILENVINVSDISNMYDATLYEVAAFVFDNTLVVLLNDYIDGQIIEFRLVSLESAIASWNSALSNSIAVKPNGRFSGFGTKGMYVYDRDSSEMSLFDVVTGNLIDVMKLTPVSAIPGEEERAVYNLEGLD